ncbi:hypothetical protein ACFYU9_22220 [Streptomyces sp. NPDC004327]|uniref:hypothetical protein n=1 Tax=Streptomyces sp. NPDC004327 TaxID=3364699 RepID=UPI00367643C5
MPDSSSLQVYSIEQCDEDGGVCIVRCISGVARVGQVFLPEASDSSAKVRPLTLDRIERYRQPVEFFDPPHSAMVYLSGAPLTDLQRGTVLVSTLLPT